MGNPLPKDIVRYQKGLYTPRLSTLEECTKEAPWGDTCKISILVQDENIESGEDLLTPTKSPTPIHTKLEEVGKYAIGVNLTREDMFKLWSN